MSHAAATPFDVVKTRMQSDPDRYRCTTTGERLSIIATGSRIAEEEGPGMLLQGITATSVGYLMQGAVKFSLWEIFKSLMGFAGATGGTKVAILVVAAGIAEVFASLLLCPFERLRIRLVSDPAFGNGPIAALTRMVREDGFIGALYGDGLAATFSKQVSYTVAKLTVFALLMDALAHWHYGFEFPRALVTFVSSLAAGLVASLASQPGDTLMTCTSSDSSLRDMCPVDIETGKPPSLMTLARTLGWKALFTGWKARLVHVEVIVVTQLLIYDGIKHSVGI